MTHPTAEEAAIRERDAAWPYLRVPDAYAWCDRRTLIVIIDKMRAEVRCPDCNNTRRVDTELGRIKCPMCAADT